MSADGKGPTRDELDAIAVGYRMSAYFQRMRHSRKCQRCGAWLAVDQFDPWLCSPCQIARDSNKGVGWWLSEDKVEARELLDKLVESGHVVRVEVDEGPGYQLSPELAEAHRQVTAAQAEQAGMN